MTSTPTIRCIGCGAPFPDVAGPTHAYMESSPGCWAAYGELLAREYGRREFWECHRLTVDAYAVQHPGRPSGRSAQSVAGHLMCLCLVLERGMPAAGAVRILKAAVEGGGPYPWLPPPASRGRLAVSHPLGATGAREHLSRVREWAASAWEAWAGHHAQVHSWLESIMR
jgi:hypothetical protein